MMQSLDFDRRKKEISVFITIDDLVCIIQDYLGYAMEVTHTIPSMSRCFKGIIDETIYWMIRHDETYRLYANDTFLIEFEQPIRLVRKVNQDWILIHGVWSTLLFHNGTRIYLGTAYDTQCGHETVFFTLPNNMHDELWTVVRNEKQFVRTIPYQSRLLKLGHVVQWRTPNGFVQLVHHSLPSRKCRYIYEWNKEYYLIHKDSVCDWDDKMMLQMQHEWSDVFAQNHLLLLIGVKSYVLNLNTRSVHKCDIPWTINLADGYMYWQNKDGVVIYL